MNKMRWIYGNYSLSDDRTINLAKEAQVSPLLATVMLSRGIDTQEKLIKYINKSYDELHSPFLMKGMREAVELINKLILENKKITVYGDYDVDGITAVSILIKYLKLKGADAEYYIPDRMDEGYGLNEEALKNIKKSGRDAVITVDTGITACNEAKLAKEIGLELIITDHHSCKTQIPDCIVVDPCRPDCEYPFKNLAGVGVVFKLITALENEDHKKVLDMFGDIIALGTVADVVSLTGENRVIVSKGIEKIMETPNIGLENLINTVGLENKEINAESFGFALAPRINAAGRIGNTQKAVRLLLSERLTECMQIALYLCEENKLRREIEQEILKSALAAIENNPAYETKKILVIAGFGWHHGVIGIVASRITEKYYKPCILISCENGIGKGSGRSVVGFNLFEALSSCGSILDKFGGHALAAGVTITQENIDNLDKAINEYADKHMTYESLMPSLNIECEIPTAYITVEDAISLELLEPYGTQNPKPYFSVCGAIITAIRLMGNDRHVKLTLKKDDCIFDVVAFGKAELYDEYTENDIVDIVGILTVNSWNNIKKPQFMFKDIRQNKKLEPQSPVPTRDDMAAVYTYIKVRGKKGVLKCNLEVLARKITYETKIIFSGEKLNDCLEIFAEMKLVTFVKTKKQIDIYILPSSGKVDLEKSKKLQELYAKYPSASGIRQK